MLRKYTFTTTRLGENEVSVFLDSSNTLWVEWNGIGNPTSMTRDEWFKTINPDKSQFSTLTNWDELDEILKGLGVKVARSSSFVNDWGNGDQDTFTENVYDFSNIIPSDVLNQVLNQPYKRKNRMIKDAYCDITYKGVEYKRMHLAGFIGLMEEDALMYCGSHCDIALNGEPIDVEVYAYNEGDVADDELLDTNMKLWFYKQKQMDDGTWQTDGDLKDVSYDNFVVTFDDGTSQTYFTNNKKE